MNLSTSSSNSATGKTEYRKLRRLLVFAGILGLFLFSLEVLTQHGIKHSKTGEVGKINGIMQQSLDAEVAVFGSSVALVHFDPEIIDSITGLKTYNFGINGTTLAQYHGLLSEFLSYAQAPWVVLAGSFSELMERDQLYEVYKFRHHISNSNIYNSFHSIDPQLTWRIRYVPLYSLSIYNKAYYQAALQGLRSTRPPSGMVNGFSPENRTWGGQTALNPEYLENGIAPEEVRRYTHMIREINAKGKKVILVLTPVYQEGQQQITFLPEIRAVYQKLAGDENYFFDFTLSPLCNQRELFYNNTHLNKEGASRFSEEFALRLKSVTP